MSTRESAHRRFAFGKFTLDVDRGALQLAGTDVALRPKSYAVLCHLVERHGCLVTRDELLYAVWGHTAVTDGVLTQCLLDIRRATGDDAQQIVRTVRGRGYLFNAPVMELPGDEPDDDGKDVSESVPFDRPIHYGYGGRPRWRFAAGIAALAVIGVAVLIIVAVRVGTEPGVAVEDAPTHRKASIAVLPFANVSGDPSQGYFADGLTDELLNSLTVIDELRVISRTSSFAVDPSRPLREVAATLGVDHILEGSVRRVGDRIRVTAQLIDAKSDSHLWSEGYDRELTLENILQIQEEIALAVVGALQVTLFTRASPSSRSDGPGNLAALDLYHEGMFFVRQIETGQAEHPSTFHQAIEKLEASIEADPDWAPSHAALGEVYHFWKDFGDPATKLRIAKAHIMDAIGLDDAYASAYTSLGYILTVEGDYDGAMRAYDRSISLGGRWPAGGAWGRAILLQALGRYGEAVEEYRVALAQDPLSVSIRRQLVNAYYCAGRYAEVIDSAVAVLGIEPHSPHVEVVLATAQARTGNLEKGLEIADALAERIETEEPFALLFALAGQEARARAALDELDKNERDWDSSVLLQFMVPAALALREEHRAMTMLEQVTGHAAADLSQAFQVILFLRCSPEMRSLDHNPRYEALLDQLGLPH